VFFLYRVRAATPAPGSPRAGALPVSRRRATRPTRSQPIPVTGRSHYPCGEDGKRAVWRAPVSTVPGRRWAAWRLLRRAHPRHSSSCSGVPYTGRVAVGSGTVNGSHATGFQLVGDLCGWLCESCLVQRIGLAQNAERVATQTKEARDRWPSKIARFTLRKRDRRVGSDLACQHAKARPSPHHALHGHRRAERSLLWG